MSEILLKIKFNKRYKFKDSINQEFVSKEKNHTGIFQEPKVCGYSVICVEGLGLITKS